MTNKNFEENAEAAARITLDDSNPRAVQESLESLSDSIERSLSAQSEITSLQIVKDDDQTLDLGTTIVMSLSAPAVLIVANAIRDWIKRSGTTKIIINDIEISNVESKHVANIIKALQKGLNP